MIEQDAWLGEVGVQALKRGAHCEDLRGLVIGDAEDGQSVDDDLFVIQNADAGVDECFKVVGQVSVFIVVAGCEVDAEGRGQFTEGSGHSDAVGLYAVKEVTGDEGNVWMKTVGEAHDSTAEGESVDVAEMQVAKENGGAAAPGRREVFKMDGDAADANPLSVEEAVDAGENGNSK